MAAEQQKELDLPYEPAFSLIERLGGAAEVARAIRLYGDRKQVAIGPETVRRWRISEHKGGTSGLIPVKHWVAIITFAREKKGITLTVADLSPRVAEAFEAAKAREV